VAARRTANRPQTSPRGPRLTRPGRRRPLFRRDLDRANSGEDIGTREGASFDVVPERQLEGIYVINSDGSGLREVVAPRAGLEHPDWSPDGRSITFNIEQGCRVRTAGGCAGPGHPDLRICGSFRSRTRSLSSERLVRKRELPLEYVVLPDPHNEGCERHPGRLLGR
jgi:hypothetical protein